MLDSRFAHTPPTPIGLLMLQETTPLEPAPPFPSGRTSAPTRPLRTARTAGSVVQRRWRGEAVGPSLDAAIERSRAWCERWWSRLDPAPGQTPWLAAIPDVGPTCEVLLADALFHDLDPREREQMLAWVRSQQQPDGGWHDLDGRPDLSLTCLGYWARVQHGDDPHSEDLALALRLIHELGGPRRANLTVRLWLAMAGTVDWDWVPAVPAELYLLPEFTPLSPARLSPWARQMISAVHLLAESNARVHLYAPSELLLYNRWHEPIPPRLTSPGLAGDLLQAFDRTIKLTRALPRGILHRRSLARALGWIEQTQQHHGGWFSTRPTLYSLLALRAAGAHSDDPRVLAGLRYLRAARGTVEVDGQALLAQGLTSRPLAKIAMLGVLLAPERVREQVLTAEIARSGPWQRRADAPTGGWPCEPDAENHLDMRTTCAVLPAIRGARTPATRASLRRAAEVMLAMQEPDGSFARFERGESDVPLSHLPWRDADQLNLGEPEDEGRVALTAWVLRELAALGWRREDDRVAKGLAWLTSVHADGRGHEWSVSTLVDVVRACAAQCPVDDPLRRSCEAALRKRQREDGSFGDPLSTARALTALLELTPKGDACVQCHRAVRSLIASVDHQRSDADPDSLADPRAAANLPGFGLSPRLRDPSAGVRDVHSALLQFRAHTRARRRA